MVNLSRTSYKDEPFILASQATQIFFVTDPCEKWWSIVLFASKWIPFDEEIQEAGCDEEDVFPSHDFNNKENNDGSDDYVRVDHTKGIWVSTSTHLQSKSANIKLNVKQLRKRKRRTIVFFNKLLIYLEFSYIIFFANAIIQVFLCYYYDFFFYGKMDI